MRINEKKQKDEGTHNTHQTHKTNTKKQGKTKTTKKKEDDKFKNVCKLHNIELFRGSTNDVAKRFIDCAKENSIETIIRITADCPIIDAKLIDDCIKLHFKKKNDYTSNLLKLSYPDGLDAEVFNIDALLKSQFINKPIKAITKSSHKYTTSRNPGIKRFRFLT